MLVLNRARGESIIIGDHIVLKVIEVTSRVRFHINAPPHVPVIRGELINPESDSAGAQSRPSEDSGARSRVTQPLRGDAPTGGGGLVLARKKKETICIGGNIVIIVVSIGSNSARIGISAPSHIPVHRDEVYERIMRAESAPGKKPLRFPVAIISKK